MAKINILDSSTYNKIAAGEVVEKPASVIKELVENSIDAHAKNIVIKIYGGGMEKIQISDDGDGIEKDDLINAFLPHATSKIKDAKDLEAIYTLGFRGEAVASISAVSNMRIASKPKAQDAGFMLECNGGVFSEIQFCALQSGTVVDVDNLFFNVPVRARFLKTERAETADISTVVSRIILGNPHISFKYYSNDKLIYQSFGEGIEEAVAAVYGADALKNAYCINTIKNGIAIGGYLGKPEYTKSNKSYQSMFINGRYVVNNTIAAAIANAYIPYLVKKQYPFYVLNVKVPHEYVDVNVHPNKTDVRFSDNQIIYGSIYSVVSSVLDGTSTALNIVKSDITEGENTEYDEAEYSAGGKSSLNTSKPDFSGKSSNSGEPNFNRANPGGKSSNADEPDFNGKNYGGKTDFNSRGNKNNYKEGDAPSEKEWQYKPDVFGSKIIEVNDHTHPNSQSLDVFAENKKYLDSLSDKDLKTQFDPKKFNSGLVQQKIDITAAVFIGQAFSTYLIYQCGDELYMVDQHAAHERLIYDKIILDGKKLIIQPLLIPFIIELNHQEFNFIKDKSALLEEMGFCLEEFGDRAFKLSEIPEILSGIDIKKFFNEFLSELNAYKNDSEYIKEKFAQKACKSAVKGGSALSQSEAGALLSQLGGDFGLKCPHGRPIAVKITKYELEKWFKRIV